MITNNLAILVSTIVITTLQVSLQFKPVYRE